MARAQHQRAGAGLARRGHARLADFFAADLRRLHVEPGRQSLHADEVLLPRRNPLQCEGAFRRHRGHRSPGNILLRHGLHAQPLHIHSRRAFHAHLSADVAARAHHDIHALHIAAPHLQRLAVRDGPAAIHRKHMQHVRTGQHCAKFKSALVEIHVGLLRERAAIPIAARLAHQTRLDAAAPLDFPLRIRPGAR